MIHMLDLWLTIPRSADSTDPSVIHCDVPVPASTSSPAGCLSTDFSLILPRWCCCYVFSAYCFCVTVPHIASSAFISLSATTWAIRAAIDDDVTIAAKCFNVQLRPVSH